VSGKRHNPIRTSSDRSFQKLASNPSLNGGYSSIVHNNIQVHKNIEGVDGWFGAGLREIRENANAARYSSKQSEERSMIKFLISLLRWPSRPKSTISMLSENREKQEKQLIEIWKATMDGEECWFKKLSEENPECVIKIAHDCTKEVK